MTPSVEIQNLDPFTLYTFKVSANTDAGNGPAAEKQSKTPEGGETWYMNVLWLCFMATTV